jgi:flagellar biosynthetic protein FlhB/flagellar biosynthesis protein
MDEDPDMAVALKYDREKDNAPRVVAKGMRFKAEQIREVAKQYGVPVLRNVPLAHALMRVDVGQEIPEALYDAVAEVLNFVYALQAENAGGPNAKKDKK